MLRDTNVHEKNSVAWATCLTIAALCLGGCTSSRPSALGPLIEAEELASRLHDKGAGRVVILDVRELAPYAQEHVVGAVQVDPAVWKDESLAAASGLDHEGLWRGRIGSLGVSGRAPVVIYDDGRMTEAARVWFIFQHFDVPNTAVLNGGYPALKPAISEGRISISRETATATPVQFVPRAESRSRIGLVDRHQVRQAAERGQAQIFDARTREEYTGVDLRKNARGGHIPSAINLPHKELLDEKGRLKSPEALAAMFQQAGFKRGQPIITHCDGGGRASLAALAAERAGYGPVMNYYLSFGDWAADATCPLAGADK